MNTLPCAPMKFRLEPELRFNFPNNQLEVETDWNLNQLEVQTGWNLKQLEVETDWVWT